MTKLMQNPCEYLEHTRIKTLCQLYITTFTFLNKLPDASNQLEKIANSLARRKSEEKRVMIEEIETQLALSVRKENYNRAIICRDMLKYFKEHIPN